MANRGQYDEEARRQEQEERLKEKAEKAQNPSSSHPVRRFAGGVKQATVDSATGLVSDTIESDEDTPPVLRTLEGARRGSEKLLDNTVRGAVKVATLGYGEVKEYKVEEPAKGSGEPTKIKIKF